MKKERVNHIQNSIQISKKTLSTSRKFQIHNFSNLVESLKEAVLAIGLFVTVAGRVWSHKATRMHTSIIPKGLLGLVVQDTYFTSIVKH